MSLPSPLTMVGWSQPILSEGCLSASDMRMGLPLSSCADCRNSMIQYTFTWTFLANSIPSVIKDFSPLKFNSYVMIHDGLSWQTFHVHLKNKNIPLLGIVFYKNQLGQDGRVLISYLTVLSMTESSGEISSYNEEPVHFSLQLSVFVQLCWSYVMRHTHIHDC